MRRRARAILATGALLLGGAGMAPIAQAQNGGSPKPDANAVKVFHAEITKQQIPLLLAAGQDGHELATRRGRTARARSRSTSPTSRPRAGEAGRRPHRAHPDGQGQGAGGEGGPGRVPPVQRQGQSPGGDRRDALPTPISPRSSPSARRSTARTSSLKLTKGAKKSKDGSKPSGAVHVQPARTRVDHARDDTASDAPRLGQLLHGQTHQEDRRLHRTVVVLSANPDGYDYTFRNVMLASGARTSGRQRRRGHLHR